MRILITGSEGFVGQHVARTLRVAGHELVTVDRAKVGGYDLNDAVTSLREDLIGCEAVVHLAAHADIRRNWEGDCEAVFADNMLALHILLEEASRARSLQSFVFVSTAAVYAAATVGPVYETDRVEASSPYAASKIAGEQFLRAYASKCGWAWYAARLAACVGTGYRHGHIADFVAQERNTGWIHALDRGELVKDVLHVEDAADALAKLAEGVMPPGIYNVAHRQGWTWRETAALMREARPDLRVTNAPRMTGWIGDGQGARMSTDKLARAGFTCERDPAAGVRDALRSLGWGSP